MNNFVTRAMNFMGDVIFSHGSHKRAPSGQPQELCIMELAGVATGELRITGLPRCTDRAISVAAQYVWDMSLRDEPNDSTQALGRRLVARFLPRIIRARQLPPAQEAELAAWCADYVEHVARENFYARACALDARACATTGGEIAARRLLSLSAAAVAKRGLSPSVCAGDAATYAAMGVQAAGEDLTAFLDGLLDKHEKLAADTPEGLYVPTDWEDEALRFIDELCEQSEVDRA